MDTTSLTPVRPAEGFVYIRTNTFGYEGHLTDTQTEALNEMRNKPFTCDEALEGAFVIDDACLLRFLRARKFDVDKASIMFSNYLAWRNKLLPSKIKPTQVKDSLLSGMVRFGPYTKQGLPTILVNVGEFDPSKIESIEYFQQFCAFFFERALSKLVGGADKCVLMFDLKQFSLRKHATPFGMKCIGELVTSIQNNNPERLEHVFIVHSPMLFSGVWKVIRPMIDPVVADKIRFVSNYLPLLEEVEAEVLPNELGGIRNQPYPCECVGEFESCGH